MSSFDPTKPGYLTTIDENVVNNIYQYYLSKRDSEEFMHPSSSHHLILTNDSKSNWRYDLAEEMEYLKQHTYPFGEDIRSHWLKVYDDNHHQRGGFLGLHQDYHEFPHLEAEGKMIITNSILLHQSDDLEGGDLIFAGDAFDDSKDPVEVKDRPYNTKHVMHRMEIDKHKKPGDVMWWHAYTIHGVSRIKKGNRVTFMIIKTTDIDDKYFRKEKNG